MEQEEEVVACPHGVEPPDTCEVPYCEPRRRRNAALLRLAKARLHGRTTCPYCGGSGSQEWFVNHVHENPFGEEE